MRGPELINVRRTATYITGVAMAIAPIVLAGGPAQSPGPTGASTAQAIPPKSTALILGQVVDGSTGKPIGGATVLLRPSAPGARGARGVPGAELMNAMAGATGGGAATAAVIAALAARGAPAASLDQRVLTGVDGRFVFHTLPPGPYQVSATLTGYTASLAGPAGPANVAMLFAGGRGGVQNAPATYALAEGEVVKDVRLRLWQFAAVTGAVVDDASEPAVGMTVLAMRRTLVAGRARYAPAGRGRTDDRGIYRIGGLLPGDYVIVTLQTQIAVPAATIDSLTQIAMTGTVDAVDQARLGSMMQIMAVLPTMGEAMASGVRLGGYTVAGAGGALPQVGPAGQLSAFRTAFYAGASTPLEATVVSLTSGEERAGADLHLRLTPTVSVSGIAVGPRGPVPHLAVRLVVPGDRIVSDTEFEVATSVTTADGRFSFFGVPPGTFLLRAQTMALPIPVAFPATVNAPGVIAVPPMTSAAPDATLFAAANVSVGTTDIVDLTVPLAESFTLSGRIEFESRSGAAPPKSFKGAAIMALPADGQTVNVLTMGRPTPVNEDGTFGRTSMVPGRYFLTVQAPPPWQVARATLDGRDAYDAPVDIKGDLSNVVITLTDRLAQLSGVVTAASPYRAADAVVIAFPADHKAWIDAGMNPRLARSVRPTSTGSYTIPNLTPGDYAVVAIDQADEGDLQDPAVIDGLSRVATRVAIAAEPHTQALTVTRVRR
jgi:hypothetical protein